MKLKTIILLILLAPCWAAQTHAAKGVDEEIRAVMHQAFDALVFLVEAAIEPGAAPRPRAEVEAALDRLELASEALQEHGRLKPAAFNLIGRSLEGNVQRMVDSYQADLNDVADLYLLDTVEHCVTCHALLPEQNLHPISARFAGVVREARVNPAMAARLLIAVRQVPRALATWEAHFIDGGFEAGEMEARAEVEEFVWHALHLTRDPQRPRKVLEALRDGDDAPFHLRRRAALWIGQLEDLAGTFGRDVGMVEIRDLFTRGYGYSDILAGRDHLVQDALVSSQAHGMLENQATLEAEERAELYFILAMVNLRSRLVVGGVPSAELYLEAAIRAAPDTGIARTAYAELQQYALEYYGDIEPGTTLFPVPMAELRALAGVSNP